MSDSVGKITLDLEVKSDLSGQINEISNKIANTLKLNLNNSTNKVFDNIDKTMKSSLNRISSNMKNNISSITNNLKNSLSRVSYILSKKIPTPKFNPIEVQNTGSNIVSKKTITRGPPINQNILATQIDTKSKMLDNINAKIEYQQSKLRSLRESYNSTFNSTTKNKIYGQILKTEESIVKLTLKSDKLGFELSDLDAKLNAIGKDSSMAGNNINRLGSSFNRLNSSFNKSNGLFNRVGNSLKSLASGLNLASNVTRIFNNNIIRSISQMFKWMILYPNIVKGIYAMSSSLFASLKTNAQFVNSLNQIKTNLMVAFMPIYQAILPAINALMRALSVITQYIASFISALFGKTYKQSFQATQSLISAKDAMGAYGKATDKAGNSIEKAGKKAKKAMGDLMGFDEINKLNMQENPDANNPGPGSGGGVSSNAPVLVQPLLDTSTIDAKMKELVDKIKKILSKIFEPFKKAWEREGAKTIKSIKYALNSILDLVKSIGISFLEVWTNGSGEKILVVILQILQNIFNIIGDISKTFSIAWNNNKIGTKIIQGIANTIQNLLTLIKKMSDSFRKAWEVVGLPLANTFMDIIDSTVGILENLSEKFIYVWDHGGSYLFESLIKLGGKIFELSGYIYNNFVAPFVNWFINIMAPAISPLMDAIGMLFDKFSETIDWLLNDGKPVLDTIVSLVGGAAGLVGAFKAAKKGIEIFDGIKSSAERLGKAFINLDPKALLIKLAIAAIIGIGIYLISHWNEIKAKCKEVWDKVQQKFQEFKNWLGSVFATDWSKQFGGFGDILNGFLKNVGNIFKSVKEIFKGIIDFVTGVFTGNWRKAWDGVVKVFGGIMKGLGAVVKSPLNAVISLVNAAISGLNKISVSIPNWIPGFGGKKFGFNIPKIPLLAKGGIIDSPTLAMVGEAGKEAVMPLENNTGWITDLANKVAANMPNNSNEKYPTGDIIIQVGNDTLAKILLSELKKIERQTGQAVIKV